MLSPKEISKKWESIAMQKAGLSIGKQLLLGFLAGAFIAFGALGSTVASTAIGGGLGRLAGAAVFPAGLMLVVMAGAELFTGNCLMAGPLCNGRVSWLGVLRNWLFVYLGNLLGARFMASLVHASGFLWDTALCGAVMAAAAKKTALPFDAALLRGIGCNILVCGAVWMASGADTAGGKAVCCFFPVMLFVLCGFEHSVANMYYVPLGIKIRAAWESSFSLHRHAMDAAVPEGFFENVTWDAFLLKNLLPVTLGNIIGGGGLAVIYAKVYKD